MTEAEQIMKQCQVGTRNHEEANNLHAACYGIIGRLLAQEPPKYSFKAHWEKDGRIGIAGVVVRPDGGVHVLQDTIGPPEQEPVAWMNDSTPSGIFARHIDGAKNFGCTIPLYTTPPQRTWAGLTDKERSELVTLHHGWNEYGQAIENKLKEKNT